MTLDNSNIKILYLVRHAKSSWIENLPDFVRPLNERGVNDANLVSNHIKTKIKTPDLILSSGADRAKTTAEIFVNNLKFNQIEFQINKDLYDFSGELLLNVIKTCEKSVNTLLIFGHNSAITNFVNS